MKWHLAVVVFVTSLGAIAAARAGCDCPAVFCSDQEETSWIFRPSYFSHDLDSNQRVAQYEPERTTYYRDDPTYMESGYRHYEYEIHGPGGAADHLHVVQTWGLGDLIRPYGEWEYPYRAGATPYGPWGNSQGPWTLPFDSWVNPYGLLQQMQNPGWGPGPYRAGPGAGSAMPYGGMPGYGASNGPGYGGGMGYGAGSGHGGVTIPATPPNPGLGNY